MIDNLTDLWKSVAQNFENLRMFAKTVHQPAEGYYVFRLGALNALSIEVRSRDTKVSYNDYYQDALEISHPCAEKTVEDALRVTANSVLTDISVNLQKIQNSGNI